MSELHLSHYDDDPFVTIDAYDAMAKNILKELGAKHVRDSLYRLPVDQVVTFLAQRFKLDVTGAGLRQISEAQRAARRKSLAQARAQRWAKG